MQPRDKFISIYMKLKGIQTAANAAQSGYSRQAIFQVIEQWLLPAIIYVMPLWYILANRAKPFYYDAQNYWDLADQFISSGAFRLTNFEDPLRGFLYPLLLFGIKEIANLLRIDQKVLFGLFSSTLFFLLVYTAVPFFLRTVLNWKINNWQKSIFAILVFNFWKGHLLFPLSDIPALTLTIASISGLALVLKNNGSPLWITSLVGIGLAGAMNIRPVYTISFILGIAVLLCYTLFKPNRRKVLHLACFVLGLLPILAGQSIINSANFDTASPMVQSRWRDQNLYVKQLFIGMRIQRYETNVGENYPKSHVIFADDFYKEVKKSGLLEHETIPNYIRLMINTPVNFALLFFRHTFNGMDIKYVTPYVENVYSDTRITSLVNYFLLFCCLWYVFCQVKERPSVLTLIGLILLLAPVALAIPTAVEIRFFLPAYILTYAVFAIRIVNKRTLEMLKNERWKPMGFAQFLLASFIFILFCLNMSKFIFSSAPL